MLASVSRAFTRYYSPGVPIKFDIRGEYLLYYSPGARTFLKVYAPINSAFVLYHSYLSVTEFMNPVIPGSYFTLAITSGLSLLGVVIAISVQRLAKTMVKSVALLEDGKHVRVTFLSAFSHNDRPTVIPIEKMSFPEETSSNYYRLTVPEVGTLFLNLHNNEITEEVAKSILLKVIQGSFVNTLGNINLNKVLRKD